MIQNDGQNKTKWNEFWDGMSPESEIRMWDYYGGRPWILKYTPRFGKVLEGGCGLGRYVFYLSTLGVEIEGLDFLEDIINKLNQWKETNKFNTNFIVGDVLNLPYPNESLSGYISLGVMEHFIDGPQKAIGEAYRVLRPGGIAIITTPSLSWYIRYYKIRTRIRNFIKIMIGRKLKPRKFFQYYYSPKRLKSYLQESGFRVTRAKAVDLLYTILEFHKFKADSIEPGSWGYRIAHQLENSCFSALGAQSITISVKTAETMYCFLCGDFSADIDSIKKFDVPLCSSCQTEDLSESYRYSKNVRFMGVYDVDPPLNKPHKEKCHFCSGEYETDVLFEDYGFNINVCSKCLTKPTVNLDLSVGSIYPIWRKRKVK